MRPPSLLRLSGLRGALAGIAAVWMGGAGLAAGAQRGDKILLCYMIELQDLVLAEEWSKITQLPFNGMIFRTGNFHHIMRPKALPWAEGSHNWKRKYLSEKARKACEIAK